MVAVHGAGIYDDVKWAIHRDRIKNDRLNRRSQTYSGPLVLAASVALKRSVRTIERWLDHEPVSRKRYELTEFEMSYISLHAGNVCRAWEDLVKLNAAPVSYKTFRRAFGRLEPGVRVGLRRGTDAMRCALPYLTLAPATRPNEISEVDHALLGGILVWDPDGRRTGHPWLTIMIDTFSRMIVGFAITLAGGPITESLFAAWADAFLGRDYDGTFVGGCPETVRHDQGSDLMNEGADALDRLGIKAEPVMAYTPEHKPYVERVIGTIKGRVLPRYPGYGERLGSHPSTGGGSDLLTIAGLTELLDQDFRALNRRRHRGIDASPLEMYRTNAIEPTRLKEEHIVTALLRRKKTAKVQKDGVQLRGIKYQGKAAFAHIGETVGLGYLDTHPQWLYIFDEKGKCLGKLEPAADAGMALANAVSESRTKQIATVKRAAHTAAGLRRELLPQLRGGNADVLAVEPLSESTLPRRGSPRDADGLARRLARAKSSDICKKA